MVHRIGEQFFENQVQVEFDLIAERMLTAERRCFSRQTFEFSQTSLEDKFRFGQNCLIVPQWRVKFQAR